MKIKKLFIFLSNPALLNFSGVENNEMKKNFQVIVKLSRQLYTLFFFITLFVPKPKLLKFSVDTNPLSIIGAYLLGMSILTAIVEFRLRHSVKDWFNLFFMCIGIFLLILWWNL